MFNPCSIIYLASGGGNFLAQILTAHADKSKTEQILTSQDNNDYDGKWTNKESIFNLHDNIDLSVSSNIERFEYLDKKSKIIFVSAQTNKDKEILEWRQMFLDNNMANPAVFRVRCQYHYEMKNYLDDKKIPYFDIPLNIFFDKNLFIKKLVGLKQYINLDLDEKLTRKMHNTWIKQNIKERQIKQQELKRRKNVN